MNIAAKVMLPAPAMQNLHDPSGIGYADTVDPSVPLLVRVGPYITIAEGDVVELYCDAQLAVTYTVQKEDLTPETPSFVTLRLSQAFVREPAIILHYKVTEPIGGAFNTSATTTVPVKLSLPGGTDIDPSTPWDNERLALPKVMPAGVITSPEGVSVEIAPYLNMSLGDKITLSWSGEFVHAEITASSQIGQPLVIPISRETIIEAGDAQELLVMYEIRDIVNNWSRWSLPTLVAVEVDDAALLAPIVAQAPNGELDLEQLGTAPVQVLVIAAPQIKPGDQLVLLVERTTAEGIPLGPWTQSINVPGTGSFYQFNIPVIEFQPIAQGTARLKYLVNKSSGNPLRSRSLCLTVVGQAKTLTKPRIPAAEQNGGVLDPAAHNVKVQVPAYHFMDAGNEVTLVWLGKTAGGANVMHEQQRTLTAADVGKPVDFYIPDDKVRVLAGGSLEVYYNVDTFMRAFFRSPSLLLPVGEASNPPLPLPSIKEAQNGELDTANTTHGATMVVPASAILKKGDSVGLFWRWAGGLDESYQYINEEREGKALEIVFSSELVNSLVGKRVSVNYSVHRQTGAVQESGKLQINVTSAWPILYAPTMDTVGADGVVDPAKIPESGGTIRVNTRNLLSTDQVKVVWDGVSDHATAEKPRLSATELTFNIPKMWINASAGARAVVTYQVRRGATVHTSHALGLTVKSQTPALPTPDILEARHGQLDTANTTNGATVFIAATANLQNGDHVAVTLSWPGANVVRHEFIDAQQAGKSLKVVFASTLINDLVGQRISVRYSVTRNETERKSDSFAVNVISNWPRLRAPYMETVGADGVVDPARIPETGAKVIVDTQGLQPTDRIKVIWMGAAHHETSEQTVRHARQLEFYVPKIVITSSEGKQARLGYKVQRGNTVKDSEQLHLTVRSGMKLETSLVTLAGKIYLTLPDKGVYPAFPANTTVHRVASGGKPPYVYRSSNESIVHVDNQGLASVRNRGDATITVTDSVGTALSYPIKVTGVIRVLQLNNANFEQATSDAQRQGARLPSLPELREIHAAFGAKWPLYNGNAWSTTRAGGVKVNYLTKRLTDGFESSIAATYALQGVGLRFS